MSDSADDIIKRMHDLRREVSHDVKGIVQSARTLTDWRYHVRHHPWLCTGLAFGLGFFIVPKRRQIPMADAKELAELLKKYNVPVSGSVMGAPSGGMFRSLLAAAVPLAARTAMHIAQNRFAAINSGAFTPPADDDSIGHPFHVPR
jgi:hypothetical protein